MTQEQSDKSDRAESPVELMWREICNAPASDDWELQAGMAEKLQELERRILARASALPESAPIKEPK